MSQILSSASACPAPSSSGYRVDVGHGAEADEVAVTGRQAFCRDQVSNSLADLM